MTTWDDKLKLDDKRTRKLARDQKIRMRHRECRARKKQEKLDKAKEAQHNVLAQAINLSNILAETDSESDELVDFLRSLDHQDVPLSPCSSEVEPMEEELEAHIDLLAEQHIQEEENKDYTSDDSDSDGDWRTGNALIINPFATKEKADAQVTTTTHKDYYTL